MATVDDPILYAQDRNGAYCYIEDVDNGDACGCFCPACGQPMRARNAGLRRRHSFAHQSEATCTWAVEAVITMLAQQAIEEAGSLALPALSYNDAITNEPKLISKPRLMHVTQTDTVSVPGRQVPCLLITVKGGEHTARFGLCVTLRRRLTEEQANSLFDGNRGVVLVDLGLDLKRQRTELGKHYDRDDLVKGYQDRDFLTHVLTDESTDLMSWVLNARRNALEAHSIIEKSEMDRRAEEQRARKQREYEETRKRQAEERRREARKRKAKEEREGIVRKPGRHVTEYDEYDLREWDSKGVIGATLSRRERLVCNGDLLALIVHAEDRESARVLTKMDADAIDEISWNLEDLSKGFDEFVVVINAADGQKRKEIELVDDGNGKARMKFATRPREYCCALQGLVYRGIAIVVNTEDRRSWSIEHVHVASGYLELASRRNG